MKKIFCCTLFSVTALMTNGCVSMQTPPSEPMGPEVYLLSARAPSRKILAETVKSAHDKCAQENKQYLFVKHILQPDRNPGAYMISYDLYFTCVDAEDPRLKKQKSLLRPAEEKTDQIISPAKEKPPAQGVARPAPEPAEEKPAVSPGKKTAPASEKLPQPKDEKRGQEEAAKVSEEQPRKKNTEPGELEDLRKDGAAIDDDSDQDSPVIEEILPGEVPAQLRWRRKKKKTKQQTKSPQ